VALPTVEGPALDLVAPDAAIGMSSQRVVLRMLAASLSAKLAREASVERQNDLALLKGEHQRLLDLEDMQQAFISMVTHELRTPLTSLRGYLDLVLDGEGGPLTTDQEAWLGVMDRNVQRLAALVEDILTLAREQATTPASAFEDVDVAALVDRSVEVSRPAAQAKGLSLSSDTAADLPPVRGEPRSLGQLLDNLVANAVKFTPAGGVVTITARCEDHYVVLEVTDTGPGIPADELPHVFDRFFRASTGKNVSGTGLGLSIAKAIVDNHRGTLEVRSELGVGSTFRATLPAGLEQRAKLATEQVEA
jgi:signal transduction histidine kinase